MRAATILFALSMLAAAASVGGFAYTVSQDPSCDELDEYPVRCVVASLAFMIGAAASFFVAVAGGFASRRMAGMVLAASSLGLGAMGLLIGVIGLVTFLFAAAWVAVPMMAASILLAWAGAAVGLAPPPRHVSETEAPHGGSGPPR